MNRVANFVASIKSAALNKVSSIEVRSNRQVFRICLALEELGYISGFTVIGRSMLRINLRYFRNKSVIRGLTLYSRPSFPIYLKKKYIRGPGVVSFIKNNNFTLFNTSSSPFLLSDVEMLMCNAGGHPLITVS